MRGQIILMLLFIIGINQSCVEPCNDFLDVQQPTSISLNLIDQTTGEDLFFGNNPQLTLADIEVLPSDPIDSNWIFCPFEPINVEGREMLALSLFTCNFLSSFVSRVPNSFVVSYNNLYPNDTLGLEYIMGYDCEDRQIPTDYNIRKNGEYLCRACYLEEPIQLLK